MDNTGTITWEEFIENAESLVSISNKICDAWSLRGNKAVPGKAYLFRHGRHFISNGSDSRSHAPVEDDDLDERIVLDPFEAAPPIERPIFAEHYVLWSISYCVPVLYFNIWKSDLPGINPMAVEEAQSLVHDVKLGYSELSQAMHPLLDVPCLHLHPCMSREILQFTSKSKNKLVSWLSVVAPAALGLKIGPEYCDLTL